MKRLVHITCSFLVLFAGVAAAWASCEQISFASGEKQRSRSAVHAHDHHSDSHHDHSHDSVIHCPSLDEFVPVATFSGSWEHRVERVLAVFAADLESQFTRRGFHRSMHGPPVFDHSSIIPSYLLLSVLRI